MLKGPVVDIDVEVKDGIGIVEEGFIIEAVVLKGPVVGIDVEVKDEIGIVEEGFIIEVVVLIGPVKVVAGVEVKDGIGAVVLGGGFIIEEKGTEEEIEGVDGTVDWEILENKVVVGGRKVDWVEGGLWKVGPEFCSCLGI